MAEAPHALDGTPLVGRDIETLQRIAVRLRRDILEMTFRAGSGHPGGSLSELETLLALYHGGVMRSAPTEPDHPGRDHFILSKGHACPGLYAVLADLGFFPREELWGFRYIDRLLQGHVDRKVPGVEMSSGSLGMGLGYGNGIALANRLKGHDGQVFVMIGDGECQEGMVWESAMTAAHRKLDTVTCILDHNRIQIDGFVEDVKGLEPLADKWRSFGWHVIGADGHDLASLFAAFDEARSTKGKPSIIIAGTVKGKGISFMEDVAEFHGRALKAEEMERAMQELGAVWSPDVIGWKEVGA
ncbi:MAG: transketolase [Euryarchaeota archaeon]|nr:transketolase [Euryarchaeota archaeon]